MIWHVHHSYLCNFFSETALYLSWNVYLIDKYISFRITYTNTPYTILPYDPCAEIYHNAMRLCVWCLKVFQRMLAFRVLTAALKMGAWKKYYISFINLFFKKSTAISSKQSSFEFTYWHLHRKTVCTKDQIHNGTQRVDKAQQCHAKLLGT